MSAWRLGHFVTRSGLTCPTISWRMKGAHQANPNRISQADIWPAYLDYHTLAQLGGLAMAARLAPTLHLLWDLMHQQVCLSAKAPKFPASMGARPPALLNVSFKCSQRKAQANGKLDASRIGK